MMKPAESRVGAKFAGAIRFLLDQPGARRLLTQTDVGSVVMILPAATETSNRPRDHCLGFHDDQGTSPAGPPLPERSRTTCVRKNQIRCQAATFTGQYPWCNAPSTADENAESEDDDSDDERRCGLPGARCAADRIPSAANRACFLGPGEPSSGEQTFCRARRSGRIRLQLNRRNIVNGRRPRSHFER